MTFGCVETETHLFYSQQADGILGLTKGNGIAREMRPIFEIMKEAGIIENQVFALCLGKDAGYFQLGGYDGQSQVSPNVTWFRAWDTQAYKFSLEGVAFNNHFIQGSEEFQIGVLDSGTTFTYIPHKLFNMLIVHFDWFCALDHANHCKGKRI